MVDQELEDTKAREAALAKIAESKVLSEQELDLKKYQGRLDQARGDREKDLVSGRARGQEVFGSGSLGRLSEGYSNEEMSAMRDQNLGTINANNTNNLRQLRIQQAAQGLRGGQATAQINKARMEQGGQVAGAERDLFLKNIDARRDSQKYNFDQGAREKQAQLTTELGYGALGSADRGGVTQGIVGEKQAAAAANSGGSKK